MAGLAVSDVVNVQINLTPLAAGTRNFGAMLIAGPSSVIDVVERIRSYSNLEGVAADFGTTTPEYLAADLFFSQSPKNNLLYIGRWASAATHGTLHGAILSPAQQASTLAALQAISSGGFTLSLDGTSHSYVGLDFTGITNLNGAATIVQTAIAGQLASSTCTFAPDSNTRFNIQSGTTGASSTVSYMTAPGSGTSVATLLGLTAAAGASVPVPGVVAETALAAATKLLGPTLLNNDVYAFAFAPTSSSDLVAADYVAVAGLIEGLGKSHTFFITTQDPLTIDSTDSTSLLSVLKGLGYRRSFLQYSTSSLYAAISAFARAATVDFTANNTLITLKFKQEPGVTAELLTETQAATLKSKNGNVFVQYDNDTAILQEGVMVNGYFFDEVFGTDWLQNEVQTALYNLLYTSPTKIPQTDAGVHQLVTVMEDRLNAGVNNGLIAPGQWNGPPLGQLQTGQMLPKGFYTYAPLVASQSQSARETRVAPTLQAAIKLAGAIHFVNVIINVNR